MKINGNLVFEVSDESEVKNLCLEKVSVLPQIQSTDVGRLLYNNLTNSIFVGTAIGDQQYVWKPVAAGGDATVLVAEIDRVEAALGLSSDGSFNAAAFTGNLAGQKSYTDIIRALQGLVVSAQASADSEAARAINVEGQLSDKITAETTRATAAEGQVNNKISSEVTRATAVEGQLSDKITTETTRAAGAEGQLNDRITTEITAVSNQLNTKIQTEINDRQASISSVQADISTETTRAIQQESAIRAEMASALVGLTWEAPVNFMFTDHTKITGAKVGSRVVDLTDFKIYTVTSINNDVLTFNSGEALVEGSAFFFTSNGGGYVFNGTAVVQFSNASSTVNAGTGLTKTGNTLNITSDTATIAISEDSIDLSPDVLRYIDDVQELVFSEQDRALVAEQNLQDALNAEQFRAEQAEQALTGDLNSERDRADSVEQSLRNDLNEEIAARIAGDLTHGGGGSGSDDGIVWGEVILPDTPNTPIDANLLDANLGNSFIVTLTLPTQVLPLIKNAKPGVMYSIVLMQDKVGSRKLTYDSKQKFEGSAVPTLSAPAFMIDVLDIQYLSSSYFFTKTRKGFTITPVARIGETYVDTLQQAADIAVDGDTTWVLRTGQLNEVNSAWTKNGFFELAGVPAATKPELMANVLTRLAYGKAVYNPEAGSHVVRDLAISGAAISPDDNGAAIRNNPGTKYLRLERLHLFNNQNGVLAGAPTETNKVAEGNYNIEIIDCDFDANGVAPSGLTHNIYLNDDNRVYVLRSRFTNARYGHDFKNRAAELVLDRTYHQGSTQGRELDTPNGGIVHAVNCYFIKNPDAVQNNLVGIGQEGIRDGKQEYIFRNCLFENDKEANFALTWISQQISNIPVKLVDCVFLGGNQNCIVGPFELYYTGGPIGPEGWDQTRRGVVPQRGTVDPNGGTTFFPADQQPQPVYGPDPTLDAFPPTGSTNEPTTAPPAPDWYGEQPTNPPAPDTLPPSVTLSASKLNVTAAGSVNLVASATDNKGVKFVEFYKDGALFATDNTTSSFSTTLNFTDANNGTYSYTAKAYDAAGNSAVSEPVVITVNIIVIPPPTVYPFSKDSVTKTEFKNAVEAAPIGQKRVAGAQALIDAMKPNYHLNIYQENTLVVSIAFTEYLQINNDGADVVVTLGTPDSGNPLVAADITQGTWHFELIGGQDNTRSIKGSVGPVDSGKLMTLSDNPEPGSGLSIVFKLVINRALDGV
ncbi:Ig-like domain-containing protein [Acinetobacter sp.]|uniref:Ig-like domain-containing protein n=1 Tax=Acinetobacter sp. TaxID=472 RepID=UPI003890AD8B